MTETELGILKATDISEPLGPEGGMLAFTSPRGFRILDLHWWADPEHTEAWANQERRKYTTRDWRREMELDWTSPSGMPFLPEFSELGRDKFIMPAEHILAAPVFRSYDFGRRRPACTWFQYSKTSDRVFWYREFMPHELQTHEFRDAVKYLSGQLDLAGVPDRAKRWIDAYAAKPSGAHCPPPWFPLGTQFIDISGKEALQGSANAPTHEEGIARNIFAEGGIDLVLYNGLVEGRYQVLRRLLRLRKDSHPGIIIDPQCEEGIAMLDGALAYPENAEFDASMVKPKDDGHFINIADALTYGLVMVVPMDAPKESKPARFAGVDGPDRREVWVRPQDPVREEGPRWYENR